MTATKKPISLPRDTTALALFGIMFLGLGLIGGSSLWGPVSNSPQLSAKTIAPVSTTFVETEQRRLADVLKTVGRNVSAIANQQDTLVRLADHSDTAVNDRFGKLEAEISALELKLRGNAESSLSDAVDQLTISGAHLWTDVSGLRSSLDEHVQTFRREIDAIATRLSAVEQGNQTPRIDALVARIEQLEQQLLARDMTSSIRPPVRKKVGVKRKPRPVQSARANRTAANSQVVFRQHRFQLPPGPVVPTH
jgi:hypothetical protein